MEEQRKRHMKKIGSLLLIVTMFFSMMPPMAFAVDNSSEPVEISTAEEFAAMEQDGNYKLTADIMVTEPYSKSFKGNFDGDGNTVTLKLETASGNAGLFSETGAGAEIRNVNVNADVISSVSGASYGTGGLIGRVYYPTVLENCSVSGSIRNTATDGNAVYTGGLVGYQADKLTMKNCCSSAEVKSDSKYYNSAVGGLIGKGGNYMVTAENCYATGSVTAEGTYALSLIHI